MDGSALLLWVVLCSADQADAAGSGELLHISGFRAATCDLGLERSRLAEASELVPEHVREHVGTVTQCGSISTGPAGRLKLQFAARELRGQIASECRRSEDCVMRSAREWWETTSRAKKQQVYWIVKAAKDESWAEVTDIVFQPKIGSVAVFRFRLERAVESKP